MDNFICTACGWEGTVEDLPTTSTQLDFWGEPVPHVTVDTTICPACRRETLEEAADEEE
jgi:hypothetical protein